MAYTYRLAYRSGGAGEAHTATVYGDDGVALSPQPTSNILDNGDGAYYFIATNMPDGQGGEVKIMRGSTLVTVGAIDPKETEGRLSSLERDAIAAAVAGEGFVADLTTLLQRILGLSGDNLVLDNPVYDEVTGQLTSAVLRAYNSKANAEANNPAVGLLYEWAVSATLVSGRVDVATRVRNL